MVHSGRWAFLAACGVVLTLVAMLYADAQNHAAQAYPTSTVSFTGHGYGHGRGLSQYGAYGYATTYSWSYTRILSHYYGGTTLTNQANSAITVRLMAWEGRTMMVTSATKFSIGGVAIPAGGSGAVTARTDGKFTLALSSGCGKPVTKTVVVASSKAVPAVGREYSKLLTLCGEQRGYRGTLAVVSSAGSHVVNTVLMEDYLRGVVPRESPASWGDAAGGKGMQALMAQTVAARSYGYSENRTTYAKSCDTTSCQVYGGAMLAGAVIEDSRANTAVTATNGKVLRSGSTIVRAEFSSSSGGYTAGGVWLAVQDLGDSASPRHNWSISVPASTIAANLSIGTLTSITVLSRNGLGADGGRVAMVRVAGSARTVEITGTAFRSAAGLYSDWFTVKSPIIPRPRIYAADGFGNRPIPSFEFGLVGDKPFSCDFDGNKADSIGVFRRGAFYVNNVPGAGPSVMIAFGQPTDRPLCGDWNGDGIGTIGVYRPSTSTFFLRNTNSAGPHNYSFVLGNPGDVPVVGDFDGDGLDSVGVYRPSDATFYLLNSNSQSARVARYHYGSVGVGDVPLIGDWNNDGVDTLGVRRGTRVILSNALGGKSSISFFYGVPGDIPLAGDWNGDGTSTVAVGRGY